MKLVPAKDAPLKTHLLFYFTLCAVVSLIASVLIAGIFVVVSLVSLSATSTNLLTKQASDALAASSVAHSAALFEAAIDSVVSAAATVATATGDSFRQDYSVRAEDSFYGTDAFLSNPVLQPPTAEDFPGMNISETHSVWILAGSTSRTPPQLTQQQTATLNAVAHVDTFLRPLYNLNPEVLSLQIGFEDGIFKSYPGTGDNLSQGPYDPRQRSWYTQAKANQQSRASYIVAPPYLSAFGRGWVLTCAKSIYSTVDNSFIGVTSIQSPLPEFSKLLSSFSYSNSSVAIFSADAAGLMLASSTVQFNVITPATPAYSFINSTNPALSNDFWQNTILPSLNSNIDTTTTNYGSANYKDPSTGTPYLILWKTLSNYASDSAANSKKPSWVAVGAVPVSNVQSTVDQATANLKSALPLTLGVSVGVFAGTLALVLAMVIFFANQIVKPLRALSDESSRITNNIGGKDLFEGVRDVTSGDGSPGAYDDMISGVDEMDAFKDSFYNMVQTIREGSVRTVKKAELSGNAFLRDTRIPEWDDKQQAKSVVALLPDHPPQYEEAAAQPPSGSGAGPSYSTFSKSG
ncbi:hypothetical protein HDU77_006772 [Chytriomyces hyalinus]|nr:hypothetical protein HDU77_006772 [Chytriomyces hyalinus]